MELDCLNIEEYSKNKQCCNAYTICCNKIFRENKVTFARITYGHRADFFFSYAERSEEQVKIGRQYANMMWELSKMRDKKQLENHSKINFFAKKWLQRFHHGFANSHDEFAEDCFSLGFDMDCGILFKVTFRDEKYFYDAKALSELAPKIYDVKHLSSAIFSRLRDIQFSHIKKEAEKRMNMSEEEIAWFEVALTRLSEITESQMGAAMNERNTRTS